ncbi:hypothetical protein NECAME_17007 [Necator americanus]|uniref:Uncharacterized protein n=1 Tax=Necator americanus TaxID=51031 RepID=W2TUN9_NECAM|nr:hypothetical protein NECAME_17007 [Necator americanus]ETN84776.1 hypothetical protein NECAME_17007 [Necator americanus]
MNAYSKDQKPHGIILLNFLKTIGTSCAWHGKQEMIRELHIDYSEYCKQQKERFEYVCPKPLRFRTYAEQAVDFCIRYTERCPKAKIPDEPVPFKIEDESHIYTREIESRCKTMYRPARTFCLHPELLKYPKYSIMCALYKADCIDVYKRVIYG